MNKVPDRKKLRREYLKKKGAGYSKIALAGILLIPCLFATTFFCFECLVLLVIAVVYRDTWDAYAGLFFFLFSSVSICLTWILWKTLLSGERQADIPYVPPVIVDTLPAEEILVRGVEAPAATSETLLRLTTATQETKAEELLRSTQE